jgi:hypothetical protein
MMILLLTFWRLPVGTSLNPWEVAMFLDRRKLVVNPGPTLPPGMTNLKKRKDCRLQPATCGAKILDAFWRDS